MEEKYLKFYNKFIRHSKTVSHCGVVHNSKLEGENYGWIISSSFLFCTCRSSCTCKNGKINKNFERKRNPGSGLQGRVIHCLYQVSQGGIILNSNLKRI